MLPQYPALDAHWQNTLQQQPRALVFCWAAWSPPGKMFAPVLARVLPEFEAQFAFFTADIDEEVLVPFYAEMEVMTTPQLVLLHQGVRVASSIGYTADDALRARLDLWLQL